MNRLQEVEHKHSQLKHLLERHRADALWIRRTRNLAWLTAGADASIPADAEVGVYSAIITREQRILFTNNIEAPRLRAEENLESLGFDFSEYPWYAPQEPHHANLITDDGAVEADIQTLRWVLNEAEQTRFRQLGQDTARAIESTARKVQKGMSEFEISGLLAESARQQGGLAVVNLIAVDERISAFRHPLPTSKRLEKIAMLVICMRREGLVCAATRFVSLGPVDEALQVKLRKIATIDASAMEASRVGRTLEQVLADIQAAYTAQGEEGQWQYHHQGGLIAYNSRERVARPGDETVLQAGQACAWNPSIVGCKSEDTILLHATGYEIVTQGDYPSITVEVAGRAVQRPAILVL